MVISFFFIFLHDFTLSIIHPPTANNGPNVDLSQIGDAVSKGATKV